MAPEVGVTSIYGRALRSAAPMSAGSAEAWDRRRPCDRRLRYSPRFGAKAWIGCRLTGKSAHEPPCRRGVRDDPSSEGPAAPDVPEGGLGAQAVRLCAGDASLLLSLALCDQFVESGAPSVGRRYLQPGMQSDFVRPPLLTSAATLAANSCIRSSRFSGCSPAASALSGQSFQQQRNISRRPLRAEAPYHRRNFHRLVRHSRPASRNQSLSSSHNRDISRFESRS